MFVLVCSQFKGVEIYISDIFASDGKDLYLDLVVSPQNRETTY